MECIPKRDSSSNKIVVVCLFVYITYIASSTVTTLKVAESGSVLSVVTTLKVAESGSVLSLVTTLKVAESGSVLSLVTTGT